VKVLGVLAGSVIPKADFKIKPESIEDGDIGRLLVSVELSTKDRTIPFAFGVNAAIDLLLASVSKSENADTASRPLAFLITQIRPTTSPNPLVNVYVDVSEPVATFSKIATLS